MGIKCIKKGVSQKQLFSSLFSWISQNLTPIQVEVDCRKKRSLFHFSTIAGEPGVADQRWSAYQWPTPTRDVTDDLEDVLYLISMDSDPRLTTCHDLTWLNIDRQFGAFFDKVKLVWTCLDFGASEMSQVGMGGPKNLVVHRFSSWPLATWKGATDLTCIVSDLWNMGKDGYFMVGLKLKTKRWMNSWYQTRAIFVCKTPPMLRRFETVGRRRRGWIPWCWNQICLDPFFGVMIFWQVGKHHEKRSSFFSGGSTSSRFQECPLPNAKVAGS